MIKTAVFDFDGVIVRRSEFFKHDAWSEIFSDYGAPGVEAVHEGVRLYGGGRGGDRFDILRHAFQTLGESEDRISTLVDETAQKYNELVQEKMIEAGVLDEDRAVLERISKRVPLYINSATPKQALERTVENLRLRSFIVGVLGRPNTKVENLKYVAEEQGIEPSEILFIGDADTDYKAGQEFGCRFIGLSNDWNMWKKGEKPFTVISSLNEIESHLN